VPGRAPGGNGERLEPRKLGLPNRATEQMRTAVSSRMRWAAPFSSETVSFKPCHGLCMLFRCRQSQYNATDVLQWILGRYPSNDEVSPAQGGRRWSDPQQSPRRIELDIEIPRLQMPLEGGLQGRPNGVWTTRTLTWTSCSPWPGPPQDSPETWTTSRAGFRSCVHPLFSLSNFALRLLSENPHSDSIQP